MSVGRIEPVAEMLNRIINKLINLILPQTEILNRIINKLLKLIKHLTEILNRTKKNSEYKKNILVYVSGFIHRRVLGKESCTQCTAYLKDGKFAHSGDLIKRKNRGSLIIPHDSVVQVVKKENQVL